MGDLAQASIRTLASLGLRLMAQAANLILVARLLGPGGFGIYAAMAALAVLLGTLAGLGTPTLLLRALSRDRTQREAILRYAVVTTLMTGSLLLALYFGAITVFFHAARIGSLPILALGAAELVIQPLLSLVGAEHHATGAVAKSQTIQMLPLLLRVGVAGALSVMHPAQPLATWLLAYFAVAGTALLIGLSTLSSPWPSPSSWHRPPRHQLRQHLGFALVNTTTLGPAELDKMLAVGLLPAAASGLYAAAARVIGAMTLPVLSVLLVVSPRMFRAVDEAPETRAHLLRRLVLMGLAYAAVLTPAAWLGVPVIAWLLGPRYAGITAPLHCLVFVIPGFVLRLTCGAIMVTTGKPWTRAAIEAGGSAALVVLAFALSRADVPNPVALALVGAETLMAGLGLLQLWRSGLIRTSP